MKHTFNFLIPIVLFSTILSADICSFRGVQKSSPANLNQFFALNNRKQFNFEISEDGSSKQNQFSTGLSNGPLELGYTRFFKGYPASISLSASLPFLPEYMSVKSDYKKEADETGRASVEMKWNNTEMLANVDASSLNLVTFFPNNKNGVVDYLRKDDQASFALTARSFVLSENELLQRTEVVGQLSFGTTPPVVAVLKDGEIDRKQLVFNPIYRKANIMHFKKESGHRVGTMLGVNFVAVPNFVTVGAFGEFAQAAFNAKSVSHDKVSVSKLNLFSLGSVAEASFKEGSFFLGARVKGSLVNLSFGEAKAANKKVGELTAFAKVKSFQPYAWLQLPEVSLSLTRYVHAQDWKHNDWRMGFSLQQNFNF